MNDSTKAMAKCTETIMNIYNMFNEEYVDHAKIEEMLVNEVCPVICNDLKTAMIMFSAFHDSLKEPEFMELVYLRVFKYIVENDLLKEWILFNIWL